MGGGIEIKSRATIYTPDFCQIFKITSIWPGHLYTISSLALKSSLYHSKSPDDPTKRLFIRHLDESTWTTFKDCLTGGYSTVNAKFAFADFGYIEKPSATTDHGQVMADIPRSIRFQKTLDANSLYAGTLCKYLMPYRDFLTLTEENQSIMFLELRDNLLASNWAYFAELAVERKKSCLVVCDVDYDRNIGLANGVDLSFFPRFKKSSFESVTKQQAERARLLKRHLDREPPKLTSTNICGTLTDFVDALCYLNVMLSLKITRVHKIIMFTQANLFGRYIEFLQLMRGQSPSPILGKMIKSIGYKLIVYITRPDTQQTDHGQRGGKQ